jgi:Uma2 family endonuclease
VDAPIRVVEVLSPGSATKDFRDNLVGYCRVASIQHYLIIDPDRRIVVHHRRGEGDLIQTRIVADGPLSLTPPGLEIAIADLFAAM